MEHGKSVFSSQEGSKQPQGKSLRRADEMRIWDCGGSECRPVMGRTGIYVLTLKCADFHEVAHHKRVLIISEGGKAK